MFWTRFRVALFQLSSFLASTQIPSGIERYPRQWNQCYLLGYEGKWFKSSRKGRRTEEGRWVFCPIRPLLEGNGPLEPLDDEIREVLQTSQKFCFDDTLRFHYCFHFRSVLKEAELFQPFCTLQSTTFVNRLGSCSNQAERGAGPRRGDGWDFCLIRPLLEGNGPLEPLDDEINGDLGEFQSENWTIAHPTACMCGWGRYHLFFFRVKVPHYYYFKYIKVHPPSSYISVLV